MAEVVEVNAVTGEVIYRDLTDDERTASTAIAEQAAVTAAADEAVAASARNKLEVLGLTPEEIAAITGQTGSPQP